MKLFVRLWMVAAVCILALNMNLASSYGFGDWRQFRGNWSSAVEANAKLPTEWVDGD